MHYLFNKFGLIAAALLLAIVSFFAHPLYAQSPGIANNPNGKPDAGDVGRKEQNATVLYANSDGGNQKNEFLYFKVYAPGGGE